MVVDKVDENRLRRMAERQGFKLVKSRRRDPLARDFERYRLEDEAGAVVAGDEVMPFSFDLSEVEEFLQYPERRVSKNPNKSPKRKTKRR